MILEEPTYIVITQWHGCTVYDVCSVCNDYAVYQREVPALFLIGDKGLDPVCESCASRADPMTYALARKIDGCCMGEERELFPEAKGECCHVKSRRCATQCRDSLVAGPEAEEVEIP